MKNKKTFQRVQCFLFDRLMCFFVDLQLWSHFDEDTTKAIKQKQMEWLLATYETLKAKPAPKPISKPELREALIPSKPPPPPLKHYGLGKGLLSHPSVGGKAPRSETPTKKRKPTDDDIFEETTGPVAKKVKRVIPKKPGLVFVLM
jgi:hypothetical protein